MEMINRQHDCALRCNGVYSTVPRIVVDAGNQLPSAPIAGIGPLRRRHRALPGELIQPGGRCEQHTEVIIARFSDHDPGPQDRTDRGGVEGGRRRASCAACAASQPHSSQPHSEHPIGMEHQRKQEGVRLPFGTSAIEATIAGHGPVLGRRPRRRGMSIHEFPRRRVQTRGVHHERARRREPRVDGA